MSSSDKYTEDEVRLIIDRALRSDLGQQTSHEELLAVAAEVGIPAESIERAAREVEAERQVEVATSRIVKRRRKGFSAHAFAFLAVNAFLFAINFLTTPGEWWALFPLFGWGLGLLFHAWAAFSRDVSERAILREQKRLQAGRSRLGAAQPRAHRSKRSAGDAPTLETASREFSSAVQERVGRVLSRAAAELRKEQAIDQRRVRVEPPAEAEFLDEEADASGTARQKRGEA